MYIAKKFNYVKCLPNLQFHSKNFFSFIYLEACNSLIAKKKTPSQSIFAQNQLQFGKNKYPKKLLHRLCLFLQFVLT
jgi:hypothetical protein